MRYILRTCIDRNNFDEYLSELIVACKRAKIDEIMLCEDSFYVAVTTQPIEKHRVHAAQLKKAVEVIKRNGLKCSFFLKSLIGHYSCGACVLPFVKFVGLDGRESVSEACVLDERVADYAAEVMSLYAACGFDSMMFDDDFRSVNHNGGNLGCFCDLHVRQTSEEYGKPLTREDLIAAFDRFDEQSDLIKKCFRKVTYRAQLALVKKVERSVHSIDESVQLGLMVSGVNADQFQGRDINELLRAFAGEGKVPFVRPPGGAYSDTLGHVLLFGLYEGLKYRAVLKGDVRFVSEIDTFSPRNVFAKSVRVFDLQCSIHALAGYDELTLNVVDHYGTLPAESTEYLDMLAENKEKYTKFADLARGKTPRGIGVVTPTNYIERLKSERFGKLGITYAEDLWNRTGLPVRFNCGEVNFLIGETLDCYTDEQLVVLFSRGVILDSKAADLALKRGFGEYIGIKKMQKVCSPCFEKLTETEANCGYRLKYPVYTANLLKDECVYAVEPLKDAVVLTELVDSNAAKLGDCSVYYENAHGGRALTLAAPFNADTLFYKGRRAQLHFIVKKLFANELPFDIKNAVSVAPIWYEGERESVLVLYNFGQDEQNFELELCNETVALKMPPLTFKSFVF